MKSSIPVNDKNNYLATNLNYLIVAKKWVLKTPERALNQAYNAVLTIKSIEDNYFNGNKISAELTDRSDNVMSYFQADLEKNLGTVKMRLAEFKASRAVLGLSNSAYLDKLGFIDEVINKYTNENDNSLESQVTLAMQKDGKRTNVRLNTYPEEIGNVETAANNSRLLSKALSRTIKRVKKDDPGAEVEVLNNFRSYRAKQTIAIRFILVLILVPLLTQQLSKHFLISPIIDHMKSGNEAQIFFNSEMKEEALHQLQSFEEDLKFDSLIYNIPQLSSEAREEQVKLKAVAIAQEYLQKGNGALSNVFADLLALVAFGLIIFNSKKQIIVLKSFIDDIVYGLSDSAKAFVIILFTDMFVGFHSPHGWEVVLEGIASHLGIPANRNLIFLFIATFPVMLDAAFKFWVFSYLSMLSPSAVATYRNMNE